MGNMEETSFNVIISGTSLTNSVLAAALARQGLSVLHLDSNEFYGEGDATHDLETFCVALETSCANDGLVRSVSFNHREAIESSKSDSRKYALDVSPKLILSTGPLVQLLVQSDVSKYMEFKSLQAAYLSQDAGATPVRVPCSKSDVFQSTVISLVEKRLLMKFLTTLQEPSPPEWADKSFADLLSEYRLTGFLETVLVSAICGLDSIKDVSAERGAALVREYVSSVGRFGPSAFLAPLYGGAEASQAFCRLAAVKGAVYILRRGIAQLTGNTVRDSEGQEWQREHLVLSPNATVLSSSSVSVSPSAGPVLYRAYCLLSKSVFEEPLAHSTHVIDGQVAYAAHLDASLKVCPQGKFLVYLWSTSNILEDVVTSAFGEAEWVIRYSVQQRKGEHASAGGEENIWHSSDPDGLGLDFHSSLEEARRLFHSICPDGEFLPRDETKDGDQM